MEWKIFFRKVYCLFFHCSFCAIIRDENFEGLIIEVMDMSVLSIHINSVNAFGYSNYLLVSISYCTILRELENFPVFLVFLWLLYVMGNYGRDV